jgi:CLIP-associating protein 1/2
LIREFEKIASTLVPEKDWSLRIAALQRVEALVYGGVLSLNIFFLNSMYHPLCECFLLILEFWNVLSGAMDYPSFLPLLKQLVQPLCTQLSDRRSTIVKQVNSTVL